MVYRSSDLLGDESSAMTNSTALFRVLGGWGHVAGPSLFMVKGVIIGTAGAVSFGLMGGSVGALLYGTASLPFIAMSSLGFVVGITRWYQKAVMRALLQLERFPALLRLHLDANFPEERFRMRTLDYFRRDEFRTSWRMRSMLVVASLTAEGAIDVSSDVSNNPLAAEMGPQDIHAAEERTIVAEASEAMATSKIEPQLLD